MKFATFFVFIIAALHGEILETAHFKDLSQHASSSTLIVLDIDDTLLVPTQTLGTDVWFLYQLDKNSSAPDPLDKTLAQWEAIRHLTEMKIVEEGSDKIVSELQSKSIRVMGLTTQGIALATRTVKQLLSHNIDLSKTAPNKEDHYFLNGHGVLYRNGILFTGGSPKGPALAKLLDRLGYRPEKIVFINDKKSHLLDVAKTMETIGIPFTGLRYSYSDARVASFRPEIAEIQFHHSNFSKILTDEEAIALLESHESP
ncbi:MAG: DUF2608 domain-containing protein [Verrucomicrobia bacterium]|nr:DUF2608 domain-containing protein [Verrucomicrobiota bacterium]